jgi:hypothetical protein
MLICRDPPFHSETFLMLRWDIDFEKFRALRQAARKHEEEEQQQGHVDHRRNLQPDFTCCTRRIRRRG